MHGDMNVKKSGDALVKTCLKINQMETIIVGVDKKAPQN